MGEIINDLRDIPLKYPLKRFLTSWPWPLTYDLDLQTWPRYPSTWPTYRNYSLYVCPFGRESGNTQTDTDRQTHRRCQNYYTRHVTDVGFENRILLPESFRHFCDIFPFIVSFMIPRDTGQIAFHVTSSHRINTLVYLYQAKSKKKTRTLWKHPTSFFDLVTLTYIWLDLRTWPRPRYPSTWPPCHNSSS